MAKRYLADPPWAMDRRDFLRLSGAGLAGVALFAASGKAQAQEKSTLQTEFEDAANKYGVPVEVLLAMGYVNTRWEMPPPETNEYAAGDLHGWGAYGIMALVQNPSANTLGEASRLTGSSEEELKADRAANIMGGAALLAHSQGAKPSRLGDWLGAVNGKGGNGKEYTAVAGVGGGDLFAEQVTEALEKGASARIQSGEQVTLRARALAARVTERGEVL